MQKIFLLAAVTLFSTGAWAQTPAGDTSSADKLGWQLAVDSYSYRNFSLFDAIDKTGALGVKYMCLSGHVRLNDPKSVTTVEISDADRQAIDDKLKANGISPIVNIGPVDLSGDEAKDRKAFEFAKKWGVNVLVAEPGPNALNTVEKLCKEYNIKVAIHEHSKPNNFWNPDDLAAALKGRSPLLGACPDIGHWLESGLDPVEGLKKLEGRIICLHFKDNDVMGPKGHNVPFGTGIGKTKEMLEELQRQHFQGAICIEYEYNDHNPSPDMAQCVKFFNDTCDQLVASPAN